MIFSISPWTSSLGICSGSPVLLALLLFEVCSNVLVAWTAILERSLVLSFACCIVVLNTSILANTVLFTNLVVVMTLSTKLLTIFEYISVILLGDIHHT